MIDQISGIVHNKHIALCPEICLFTKAADRTEIQIHKQNRGLAVSPPRNLAAECDYPGKLVAHYILDMGRSDYFLPQQSFLIPVRIFVSRIGIDFRGGIVDQITAVFTDNADIADIATGIRQRLKQFRRPLAVFRSQPLIPRLRKQVASHIGIFHHDPGNALHTGDIGVNALVHHVDQLGCIFNCRIPHSDPALCDGNDHKADHRRRHNKQKGNIDLSLQAFRVTAVLSCHTYLPKHPSERAGRNHHNVHTASVETALDGLMEPLPCNHHNAHSFSFLTALHIP